jgi:S-adenosylmethionine:tRNA ribosyltransferase-isomerase
MSASAEEREETRHRWRRKPQIGAAPAMAASFIQIVPELSSDLFDYHLPSHLIAQRPTARRDQSRLMVVDRAKRQLFHHSFADLPKFLNAGDTLFRNNAAVLPARLQACRPSGGRVECFLLSAEADPTIWRCLIKPGKKLPEGACFDGPDGSFRGKILHKFADGSASVQFQTKSKESVAELAQRLGQIPLPPYIDRDSTTSDAKHVRDFDRERYQTVYADSTRSVAVAAPTAGLHFTPELLQQLVALGVNFADLTLHVGLGTFKPIATEFVESHPIHREIYEISAQSQRALFEPRTGRRIAVGTTSVRTIEDYLASRSSAPRDEETYVGEAALFIYPPRTFLGVDALITNFHQPRSTLLCLVSAFLTPGNREGIEWIRSIYAEAIQREYRFFSYGDAMLII